MHLPLYCQPPFPIPQDRFDVGYYVAMNPDCQATCASEVYDHYLRCRGRAHKDAITVPLNVKYQQSWIETVKNNIPFTRDNTYPLPVVQWCTLNGLTPQQFVAPSQFNLMLDFNLLGGTYTYSQFLQTQLMDIRPLIRLVGFEQRYYIWVMGDYFGMIDDVMTWISTYAPRASLFFANHWLGSSTAVVQCYYLTND